jgi:hypothetical protein
MQKLILVAMIAMFLGMGAKRCEAVVIVANELAGGGTDILGDGFGATPDYFLPAVNGTYRFIGHIHDAVDDGEDFDIFLQPNGFATIIVDDDYAESGGLAQAASDYVSNGLVPGTAPLDNNYGNGNSNTAEFKWIYYAANQGGAPTLYSGFVSDITEGPYDTDTFPVLGFRAFGGFGSAGVYIVDVVLSGYAEATAVPEPSTFWLSLICLISFGLVAWRRRTR